MIGVRLTGLDALKQKVRSIAVPYRDREARARRLFIEERAAALHFDREREFEIRTAIATFFGVPYSAISFCGSAQIGFSVHKDRLFEPTSSDLDAACVSSDIFQKAWADVITTTQAFTDDTPFGTRPPSEIAQFKDQILRRGMIRIDAMPLSKLSRDWSVYQGELSRKHRSIFKKITLAVYMNEYAFCWKQDSALAQLLKV